MGGTVKTEVQLKKPWYQSSTIWLNVVPLAVVLLETIMQTNLIKDKDVLAIVVAIANILNRLRTSQGVK